MEYNGKIVIFTSDKDCSFWVNSEDTRFEDGSPVSTEDIVELLTIKKDGPYVNISSLYGFGMMNVN